MTATRYVCQNEATIRCDRGDGRPKRKKCSACGSTFRTESGLFGVFVWTGDGRYPVENAVATFASVARADALCTTDERYVVRWITHHNA